MLANCRIMSNSSSLGGGLACEYESDPTFANCTVAANSANLGGGVSCFRSAPVFENCRITLNTAQAGGGYYCESSLPKLFNCTITENAAQPGYAGGLHCLDGSFPRLKNCILWADRPHEIQIDGPLPPITYSDVQGGFIGRGNIDEDPLFMHLANIPFLLDPRGRWIGDTFVPKSPCIDAGDPAIHDGISDWHPRWPNWYPNARAPTWARTGGPGTGVG